MTVVVVVSVTGAVAMRVIVMLFISVLMEVKRSHHKECEQQADQHRPNFLGEAEATTIRPLGAAGAALATHFPETIVCSKNKTEKKV